MSGYTFPLAYTSLSQSAYRIAGVDEPKSTIRDPPRQFHIDEVADPAETETDRAQGGQKTKMG